MLWLFLKAILVGILASAPLGPVEMLVIRKTFQGGRAAGSVTGFGSSLVDTFYSFVAILTVTVFQDFIREHGFVLNVLGGIVVGCLGIALVVRKVKVYTGGGKLSGFAEAATCALLNPGALAFMMALVAFFGIEGLGYVSVAGVFIGTVIWWSLLPAAIWHFRNSFKMETIVLINKLIGVGVIIFGIIWIVKAFLATG